MHGVHLSGCSFQACAFRYSLFTGSRVRSSSFLQCMMRGVSFNDSRIAKTVFKDCMLEDADFSFLKTDKLSIQDSVLSSADFSSTALAAVDLSGSHIDGIRVGEDLRELRGARLDVGQLIELAPVLGIVIR